MDIHKPKPIHNWREFLKEYAIIVLGVATALAAEQAVETLHNHSRAAEARTQIRAEIAYSLGQMGVRQATEVCTTRRLDEVDALIAASVDRNLPQDALWIGRPLATVGSDSQYKSASESGSVSLKDNDEQATYAQLYRLFATYDQQQLNEQKAWADLRTLERHPPPTPAIDVLLRSAVQQARSARWYIEAAHQRALTAASKINIKAAWSPLYKQQSVCVPLHTPRVEAVKLVAQGRPENFIFDEP
jgi:hypothetical protein